jgi:hypothetical protein
MELAMPPAAEKVTISKSKATIAKRLLKRLEKERRARAIDFIGKRHQRPPTGKPVGRPTEYKKEFVNAVRIFVAVSGNAAEDLCEFLDVSVGTLRSWQEKYPEFNRACNPRGVDSANAKVQRSLFKRATGFKVRKEKLFYDSRARSVVRANTIEYYPPSETAASYWLNNRMPEQWRTRVDIEGGGQQTLVQVFQTLQAEKVAPENALDAYNALLDLTPADYETVDAKSETPAPQLEDANAKPKRKTKRK